SGSPFKFSARVEVRSQVAPKDYGGIALSRRPTKVTDDEITQALEGYRRRFTEYKPVEGRAETSPTDVVLVEVRGRIGEHKIKQRQVAIDREDEAGGALPGLAPRLRGLPIASDQLEVKYTLPDDALPKELAGKPVDLKVTIKEAREKKVPALDDELA